MGTINLMSDAQLKAMKDNLKECNVYLKALSEGRVFSVSDPAALNDISKNGLSTKYFQEGDQVVVDYTSTGGTVYSMPWDMYLGKSATLADGTTREGIYLQSHYATIDSTQFDAIENEVATEGTAIAGLYYYGYNGTTYTYLALNAGDTIPYGSYTAIYHNEIKDPSGNICKYGYNRYSHGAYHQWLNSAELKNLWWTPKHIGDCAPPQLETINGFLAGLPADFVNAIETVKVHRLLNTVSEPDKTMITETFNAKFFLPSLDQMYITPQIGGVEGQSWEYYEALAVAAGLPGKFAQGGTYTQLVSYALENHTSEQQVRLGSAAISYSCFVWNTAFGGLIAGGVAAYGTYRCRPVCFI